MAALSIGAVVADDLNRNYIPTVYSMAQLKKEGLVPNSLIFAFLKKGKTPVNLVQIDVCPRIDIIDDIPLPTPKYEIDAIVATRHRFRQYSQWFFDDGRNIRPLMKSTLNDLSEHLLIETRIGTAINQHIVTHV